MEHTPLHIHGEEVEQLDNTKFLGITSDLTWSTHTAYLVEKAHQRLFFLSKLRRAGLSPQRLTIVYTATIASILSLSATVVLKLHCAKQEGRGPGGGNRTGDCGGSTPTPGLSIRQPGSNEGSSYGCSPHPPRTPSVCGS